MIFTIRLQGEIALSDQDTRTAESTAKADKDLGPVILKCRPLSPMRWVAAQGLGVLGAYVAMPLGIIPFFALWPAMGAFFLVQGAPQWAKITTFTFCFVIVYTVLIWLVYIQPRGDRFILCRNGFQLKITFKHRSILFSELRSITFGLESAVFRALTGALTLARPGQAVMLQDLASAAMNIHYKDGGKTVFKSFLHRFKPDDLQEFFNYLAEHHPELCQGAIA